MAYEYNPESNRFNLPNPHRVENFILIALVVVLLACGLYAWLEAREGLRSASFAAFRWPFIIGLTLLSYGIWAAVRVMRQLTFYFGRDKPPGLRPDQKLMDTIRQNAVNFPVPKHPTDQLLYRLVPNLVFSPLRVQERARQQFNNSLVLLAIGGCYLIATLGGLAADINGWVNLVFFVLISAFIMSPLIGRRRRMMFGPVHLIVLLALSILGPTALALLGADLPPPPTALNFAALNAFALVVTLAINGLFIAALLFMVMAPARISSANYLSRLSMNAHPRQLVIEFDRMMQELWTEQIPHRVFTRQEPQIEGEAGRFSASVLEESQPVPRSSDSLTFADALQSKEYRFLTIMDLFALLLGSSGAIYLSVNAGDSSASVTGIVIGIQMVLLSLYALTASNFLWRRFEFTSRAYWLQIDGNFQVSNVDYGRTLDDAVKTSKRVITIDDMTMRLWVTDLYSVSFDIDEPRDLIAMAGVQDEAERLGQSLASFAMDQKIFVAPTSMRDAHAISQMASMNATHPTAPQRSLEATKAGAAIQSPVAQSEPPQSDGSA